MKSMNEFFQVLLQCKTSASMRALLANLGDHSDIELDHPFGPLHLFWHPFGDKESNISSIGLGTKAGRSLTERITNAQDALLEREAAGKPRLPKSPWEAAEKWFRRPASDRDRGLFQWSIEDVERRILVLLLESDERLAPTVDVLDDGIGIRPEDFPKTILSLQAGNKIKNRHLIGAFGQGGAATLGFCEYTMIISRSLQEPERIGFTIVRVVRLSEQYKEDCYCYLAIGDSRGGISVPSVSIDKDNELMLYPERDDLRGLRAGTLVRHICYKLVGLEKGLGPAPGNLWHFLHVSMFDPILPFRLYDLRPGGKDRPISGTRNRLLKLAHKPNSPTKADTSRPEGDEESGSSILHYRPMEFVTPHGATTPCVGIEFWVIANYQKRKSGAPTLRARSNELFVQPRYPIVGTLNGQNQGELPARVIAELGLQMVSQHIVVHMDASRADSKVRRELFSTSREGFKDGPVLASIVDVLKSMLEEDDDLQAVERKLTEKLVAKENQETKTEVKREVQKLLVDAGLDLTAEGTSHVKGKGPEESTKPRRRGRYRTQQPLPTLPYPQVTFIKVVHPMSPVQIPQNDHVSIVVETDADSQYDREGRLSIRSEPGILAEFGKAPLRGGRVRWRIRPSPNAKIGAQGRVVVALTQPNGMQLSEVVEFEISKPTEEKSKKTKGKVPPFDIIGINPEDNPEQWENTWPDLGEEDPTQVSYKVISSKSGLTVFYSEIFGPFKEAVDALKRKQPSLVELFVQNYEVWIGYHAILQHQSEFDVKAGDVSEEIQENLQEKERARVARMQVNQAQRVAKLQHDLLKSSKDVD